MEQQKILLSFNTADINAGIKELQSQGVLEPFIVEDYESGLHIVGGLCDRKLKNMALQSLTLIEDEKDIWQQQWEQFAPNFKDGLCDVHMQEFGGEDLSFKMKPGPGFGDVSHPTTRICLRLMQDVCKDAYVIDIGCGSGVLTLAAYILGAKEVLSIDIDPQAIEHTKENLLLNGLPTTGLREKLQVRELKQPLVILMNMIPKEQEQVLEAYPFLDSKDATWIKSGFLIQGENKCTEESKIHKGHNSMKADSVCTEGKWSGFRILLNNEQSI